MEDSQNLENTGQKVFKKDDLLEAQKRLEFLRKNNAGNNSPEVQELLKLIDEINAKRKLFPQGGIQ